MTVRECTSCGAVAEFPESIVSMSCAYCDAPLVDGDRARAEVKRVAPFRIQRSVAEQRLSEHLADRFWAPNSVRKGLVRDHKLKGVLVPFWAYTGTARSNFGAKVGIYWWKTVTYVDSKGRVRTRQERRTEWFTHDGSAIRALDDHLVSASSGLEEAESNALEPFDLGRAEPFSPEMVSGWSAELSSVGRDTADGVCVDEVHSLESSRIATHLLPGNVNTLERLQTDVDLDKAELVLLPVWIASYRHGDKVFRQLVNGQTGLTFGDTPTSWAKVAGAIGFGLLLLAALVAAVQS